MAQYAFFFVINEALVVFHLEFVKTGCFTFSEKFLKNY